MMRYRVAFGERRLVYAAWTPTTLDHTAIHQNTQRVRGWAMVRGVHVAGPAFVALTPALGHRLCLPLTHWVDAHPETGIRVERIPGGPVALVHDVPLEDLPDRVAELTGLFAPNSGLRAPAEFEPGLHGRGDLTLPLRYLPLATQREIALPLMDNAVSHTRVLQKRQIVTDR